MFPSRPKATVYVYQTDSRGFSRPDDAMGNRDPRLKALLRTDAGGRYSFTTIRPGSYPGSRVPQHIHYEVAADGHGSRVFEIVFDDDPFVDTEVRRRAAQPGSVFSLKRVEPGPDGVGKVDQDVVLGGPRVMRLAADAWPFVLEAVGPRSAPSGEPCSSARRRAAQDCGL